MILDAIIAFFMLLVGPVITGSVALAVLVINLCAVVIEAVVGIFVSGFTLRRIERKKDREQCLSDWKSGLLFLAVILVIVAGVILWPRLTQREITLVAPDGHSLPYVALIIHGQDGDTHERSDESGRISVPRFGVTALSVKDPRYVTTRWPKADWESNLTVERTLLGSGLDRLAGRLLKKPAKE